MAKTKFCAGISDISDSYMGMIIDQWGVLHDGDEAFDGVPDCLKELKERKKTIILLSNTINRAAEAKAELKKMGIGPSLYNYMLTTGELIWEGLKDQKGVFEGIGRQCYLLSKDGTSPLVEDNDIEVVSEISEASFILVAGMPKGADLAELDKILRKGIQKRIKMICANPDSRALITSDYLMGPGLLARKYQDFGGIVHYIGKPHQPIFRHCIEYFQGKEIYPAQTVVIGDTFAHDILGGNAAGMDTCLVKTGMHMANFAHCENLKDVDVALKNLMALYNNVMPTYLVDEFKWGMALPDRKHKKRKQPGK